MAKNERVAEQNAISVVSRSQFLALADESDYKEAMEANLLSGETLGQEDLTKVKMPMGGSLLWSYEQNGNEETTQAITGILVYFCKRGVLWGTEDTAAGAPPVLESHDLITATQKGEMPPEMAEKLEPYRIDEKTFHWAEESGMPYNQWGTGKKGYGKACKEQRVLFLLRENEPFPLYVTVQPGSLKTVVTFLKKLPVPHWRAIVELRLQKATSKGGDYFSQIVPRLVGTLSKEDGLVVKELYTEPLRGVATQVDVDSGFED